MNDRHRRHGGGRYRGHRGRRFGRGGYRSDDNRFNRKPETGILAFLKRLFGLGRKEDFSRPQRTPQPIAAGTGSYASSTPEGLREGEHRREYAPQELHTPKLYVGNLSYDSSESDLFDLFSQIGSVGNVEIVRDRQSNSKGFGFIEMQSIDTAKAAVEKFNGMEFMGRHIVVSGAKS